MVVGMQMRSSVTLWLRGRDWLGEGCQSGAVGVSCVQRLAVETPCARTDSVCCVMSAGQQHESVFNFL